VEGEGRGRNRQRQLRGRLHLPGPPALEPLLDVLAFLARGEGDRLTVVGLSYGTLYPPPRDVDVFRRLVREAIRIQNLPDPEAIAAARLNWLVSAVEYPATRWHGLYELDSSRDRMLQFFDDRRRTAGNDLSEAHGDRLVRAFVEAPRLDATFPMLLQLIGRRPSAEVDATAVAAIDTLMDQRNPPYWTNDLIALTTARLGLELKKDPSRKSGKRRKRPDIADDPLLGGLDVDPRELSREWAALRRQLTLPPRRLEMPSRAMVGGVGSDTPPRRPHLR
jgi:hypothetical protein